MPHLSRDRRNQGNEQEIREQKTDHRVKIRIEGDLLSDGNNHGCVVI
jgi:hypothetical protein